jgi:hypothetical protein
MVKFDHDFTGREACENVAKNPRRKKVTLAWNAEDVTRVVGSLFQKGDHYKVIDLPLTNYASLSYDKAMRGGKMIGFSTFSSYSYNERTMLSLGIIDAEHAEVGTQISLIWAKKAADPRNPPLSVTSKWRFAQPSDQFHTLGMRAKRTRKAGARRRSNRGKWGRSPITPFREKWGLTPLATTTVSETMTPVSTEGQTPFSPKGVIGLRPIFNSADGGKFNGCLQDSN